MSVRPTVLRPNVLRPTVQNPRWLSLHAMLNNIDRPYDTLIIVLSEINMLHFLTLIDRKILKVRIVFIYIVFDTRVISQRNSM